jgi:hypothetical protein
LNPGSSPKGGQTMLLSYKALGMNLNYVIFHESVGLAFLYETTHHFLL